MDTLGLESLLSNINHTQATGNQETSFDRISQLIAQGVNVAMLLHMMGKEKLNNLKNMAEDKVNSLKEGLQDKAQSLKQMAEEKVGDIKEQANDLGDQARQLAETGLENVQSSIPELPTNLELSPEAMASRALSGMRESARIGEEIPLNSTSHDVIRPPEEPVQEMEEDPLFEL